ncbi:MAG: hypothetical protein AABX51_04410 [Nanoarchaeota archaeon]
MKITIPRESAYAGLLLVITGFLLAAQNLLSNAIGANAFVTRITQIGALSAGILAITLLITSLLPE